MKWSRPKRVFATVAMVVLVLFFFRPGASRLRNRISVSIGNAVGRQVSIENVHFHALPRPGFDLEGLTIYDDPEFSAEPMIRAAYVSAPIRFRSLIRGRIEIASLSANYPSINLVRNENGRWNFTGLLERNAQIPAAPTEKPGFERRPAFPYLEADHARINFKVGAIKKSYALMDADVAFWQDSENSWSARLKATPVRTDFNLTDIGVVTIEGNWKRAANLRSTPVQLSVQWKNGQLGQITKLFSGNDRGWRGAVNFSATLQGTSEALTVQSNTQVDGFHRYDIVDRDDVRLAAKCSGQYDALAGKVSQVLCESPVGTGEIKLTGSVSSAAAILQNPTYQLTVAAENVPVSSIFRLLRQSKKYVPAEITADGALNGEFRATRFVMPSSPGSVPRMMRSCSGTGVASKVHISSPKKRTSSDISSSDQIVFASIPLELSGCAITRIKTRDGSRATLKIGPATMAINSSAPLTAGGSISHDGYQLFLRGDSTLRDVFSLEDVLGIPGARPIAEGLAKLDVGVSGSWQGFAAPELTGGAQLRNVHATVRWMNSPLEIASATASITSDALMLQKIVARTGGTHWSGRVRAPRHCLTWTIGTNSGSTNSSSEVAKCKFHFDLNADNFTDTDLVEWFSPHPEKRPWYRILETNSGNATSGSGAASPLRGLQAAGSLRVARFTFNRVTATQVSSNLDLDLGTLTLTAASAQLLEGSHKGNWVIDLNRSENRAGPRFHGVGTLVNVSLEKLGASLDNSWISGMADGTYSISGEDLSHLFQKSEVKLKFVVKDGSLLHLEMSGPPQPLRVESFAGELNHNKDEWRLFDGILESPPNTYKLSGTASSPDNVDFMMTNNERSWSITGSLAQPHIVSNGSSEIKRTEATVKPEPQVEQK